MSGNDAEIVQEHEVQIAELEREVEVLSDELAEIYASKSWRVVNVFHWFGRQYKRTRQLLNIIFAKIRSGSFLPLVKRAGYVLWDGGWKSFISLLNENLEKHEKSENTPVSTESPFTSNNRGRSQRPAILFVSHEATRTGAPIFLLNLMYYLVDKLDMEIVILLRRGGDLEGAFHSIGTTILLNDPDRINPSVLRDLKKRNIKLIYSNTITNGVIQRQLKKLRRPILCHVHELAFSIGNFFGDENFKWIKESTSLFLAGSKAVSIDLIKELDIPEEKISLAYPFIKADENQQMAKNEKNTLNFQDDVLVVGACGTISWRKGPDIFLQVARLVLQQTDIPVVFVWLGGPLSGDIYLNLCYDISMMKISKNVLFTGSVKSHIPYFSRFDIFILPSREDPFPLVALDAASLGVPIVCFDQAGGTPELVESDAGIISPYLDSRSMANSILELINDRTLRKKFGKRAQQKVMERHDFSVGGEAILKIIKDQLDK